MLISSIPRWSFLPLLIALLSACGAGQSSSSTSATGDLPKTNTPRAESPTFGAEDALVEGVFWGDSSAASFADAYDLLSALLETYPDDFRLVYRHRVLRDSHRSSDFANVISALHRKGGDDVFWHLLGRIAEREVVTLKELSLGASQYVGDDASYRKDAADRVWAEKIESDQSLADELGIGQRPTLFFTLSGDTFDLTRVSKEEVLRAVGIALGQAAKTKLPQASGEQAARLSELVERGDDLRAEAVLNKTLLPLALEAERFKVTVRDDEPSVGPQNAAVTIVEWSDFQCPFCARVEPTLRDIRNRYGNNVRVIWRNNPLPFHKEAMPAAEAVQEAHAQGLFWPMHRALFENQQELSHGGIRRLAEQVGLNMVKFDAAMRGGTHKDAIRAQQEVAQKFGARGTPAFFINGRLLSGAQPFENFAEIIDQELVYAAHTRKLGAKDDELYETMIEGGLTKAEPPKPRPVERRPEPDPNAVYKVEINSKMPSLGRATALVTLVISSDFECPFCGRLEPTLVELREKYGKELRIVWSNNPLPFHQRALPAAEAALEVFAQKGNKGFWKMHQKLFENSRDMSDENLEMWAKELGLNMKKYRRAMEKHTHRTQIEKEQQAMAKLGARGTPSSFINGRNVRGAQPRSMFETVIDQEMIRAKEALKAGVSRRRLYRHLTKDGATAPKMIGVEEKDEEPKEAEKIYELKLPKKAPYRGKKNAKIVIQVFSDFQCPFCSRVLPTVDRIEKTYRKKVQIVWRDYPLPFHQNAMPAAQAAREVFLQKGNKAFWKFHDTCFANQRELTRENLEIWAKKLGVNMKRFRSALDSEKHKAFVKETMDAVSNAGARIGTPSFFINGRLVQGAQPFEAFQKVIDEELNKK